MPPTTAQPLHGRHRQQARFAQRLALGALVVTRSNGRSLGWRSWGQAGLCVLLIAVGGCTALTASPSEPAEPEVQVQEEARPVQVPLGTSPVRGASDALVTVVEFVDFECPYCAHAQPTLEALLRQYPGELRWVLKHNPLSFHPRAAALAVFSIEVQRQRGDAAVFDVAKRFFESETLDAALLQSLAVDFQLEPAGLRQALALSQEHPVLVADQDLAMDLEVEGTPNFFINGVRLRGAQPYAVFDALVQRELVKARALLAEGVPRSEIYAVLQSRAEPPLALQKITPPEVDASMPSAGSATAPVTLQIFSDFECPFCARVMPTLDQLQQRYPEQLRVVWRHLPLSFHRQARLAATAAEEARRQQGDAAFWALARKMLGSESAPPELLNHATLERYGQEIGLDPVALQNALRSEQQQSAIDRDVEVARRLGIEATPAFIINGYTLLGAQPFRRFDRLVRLALQESASGVGGSPVPLPKMQ